jgi:Tfp pilus assembly protein PilW
MTMIELILALLLLNVVILTGISMEFGARRIFSATDLESLLMGELAPIASAITTDINRGIGTTSSLPYSTTNIGGCTNTLRIRTDADNDGQVSGGDVWVAYCRTTANNFRYYPNAASTSTYTTLSDRITQFTRTASNDWMTIVLAARVIPGSAINLTNPEVVINSSAQFRSASFQ